MSVVVRMWMYRGSVRIRVCRRILRNLVFQGRLGILRGSEIFHLMGRLVRWSKSRVSHFRSSCLKSYFRSQPTSNWTQLFSPLSSRSGKSSTKRQASRARNLRFPNSANRSPSTRPIETCPKLQTAVSLPGNERSPRAEKLRFPKTRKTIPHLWKTTQTTRTPQTSSQTLIPFCPLDKHKLPSSFKTFKISSKASTIFLSKSDSRSGNNNLINH